MGLGPKTHSLGFRAETSGKLSDFAGAFGGSASFGRSGGLRFPPHAGAVETSEGARLVSVDPSRNSKCHLITVRTQATWPVAQWSWLKTFVRLFWVTNPAAKRRYCW